MIYPAIEWIEREEEEEEEMQESVTDTKPTTQESLIREKCVFSHEEETEEKVETVAPLVCHRMATRSSSSISNTTTTRSS